MLIFPPG